MARTVKKATILTPEEKLAQAFVPVAEQPYQVPKNWCWIRLDALKVDANGFFDGDWILSENMDSAGEVRLLQLSDIGIGEFIDKSDKHISEKTYRQLGCTPLHEGDVMISRMAEPIARSCIVPSFPYTVITAVDVAVIRCNPSIVINCYLNYLCNAKWFTDLAFSLARGTTRVRITRKNLGDMPVPIPPLAEQQRIVDSIGSLFAKLDEAKEKAQAVVDGFEDRKAAILHKAFTGELISISNGKTVSLESIVDSIRIGPFGSALHKEDYIHDGIPVINPKHIVNQQIVPDEKTTISKEKADELCGYRLKQGDIVMGRRGEMGRSAPVTEKQDGWLCGTGSLIIRLQEGYNASFYSQIIASHSSIQYLEENCVGSTMNNLNEKIVKGLPVPNYSKEEQQRIVTILTNLFEKEQLIKEDSEQVINQIDTMKKSILARAFRGELGTNDPADESAEELLKRIL